MGPRKRRSHQGLRRYMDPRCRLPGRSRSLEHNQCRSLFPLSAARLRILRFAFSDGANLHHLFFHLRFVAFTPRFSTRTVHKTVHDSLRKESRLAFTGLHRKMSTCCSIKLHCNGSHRRTREPRRCSAVEGNFGKHRTCIERKTRGRARDHCWIAGQ